MSSIRQGVSQIEVSVSSIRLYILQGRASVALIAPVQALSPSSDQFEDSLLVIHSRRDLK